LSILIFEDSSSSTFGGGQQVSFKTIKLLSKFDDLLYIDFTNRSKFFEISKNYFKSYLKLINSTKIFSLLLIPINFFNIYIYIKKNKSEIKFVYATAKRPLLYAYLIYIFFDIKYIFHVHNIYYSKSFTYKYLFKKLVKNALINICVSKSVYISLSDINSKVIIYNPVETISNIKENTNFKEKNIINLGFIGSLIKCKNVLEFLNLANYLDHNRYNFFVFGNGPNLSNLKYQYSNSNIFFKDFVLDKKEIFNIIDILITPSRCNESFSLVVFEAFSYNVPVIAYNQGAHKEFLTNNFDAILYDNGTSEIIDAIYRLEQNSEFKSYIINNAKRRVQEFSINNYNMNLITILHKYSLI
jgi:glycosyltransferase involved in cell wall biosynthesis